MKINHISVSRKNTWDTCQVTYKYRYHLELKPNKETPIYFTYGKLVHRIIEDYTKSGGKSNINQIAKDLIDGKLELQSGEFGVKLPSEYKNKLFIHIKNFLKLCDKIGFDGKVEYPFNVDLD